MTQYIPTFATTSTQKTRLSNHEIKSSLTSSIIITEISANLNFSSLKDPTRMVVHQDLRSNEIMIVAKLSHDQLKNEPHFSAGYFDI